MRKKKHNSLSERCSSARCSTTYTPRSCRPTSPLFCGPTLKTGTYSAFEIAHFRPRMGPEKCFKPTVRYSIKAFVVRSIITSQNLCIISMPATPYHLRAALFLPLLYGIIDLPMLYTSYVPWCAVSYRKRGILSSLQRTPPRRHD